MSVPKQPSSASAAGKSKPGKRCCCFIAERDQYNSYRCERSFKVHSVRFVNEDDLPYDLHPRPIIDNQPIEIEHYDGDPDYHLELEVERKGGKKTYTKLSDGDHEVLKFVQDDHPPAVEAPTSTVRVCYSVAEYGPISNWLVRDKPTE
jgi:hypothetical protein